MVKNTYPDTVKGNNQKFLSQQPSLDIVAQFGNFIQ